MYHDSGNLIRFFHPARKSRYLKIMQKKNFLNKDKNKDYFPATISNDFMQMWHVVWEQFCCSCMYTKTARNKSQLFKETTWVVIAYSLGNFLYVRPVDQQRRQLEEMFYSTCCIMGSGVGGLARKIRVAMTVVLESWITQ